jgi:hypothetical protein
MHVHLANVLSDISGVTGLAMIRAVLAGERDPATRAALKDSRMNASPHTMASGGHLSTPESPPWRPQSHHRHGPQTRPSGLPQA